MEQKEQEKKLNNEVELEETEVELSSEKNEQEGGCCSLLNECKTELASWQEKCKRTTADFENYKRRAQKEQQSWTVAAQKKILLDMLTVVDDFERALEQNKQNEISQELRSWIDGITMVYQSVQKILQQHNVQALEETKEFDPALHEAIVQVESDKHISGEIVQVIQKGYTIGEAILRPAKVSVAK